MSQTAIQIQRGLSKKAFSGMYQDTVRSMPRGKNVYKDKQVFAEKPEYASRKSSFKPKELAHTPIIPSINQ